MKHLLSSTCNAPKEAFDDANQYLFQGQSVDDLFFMHMNYRFFRMEPMVTFARHDVMKNPDIENAFARFETHLNKHVAGVIHHEQAV